MPDGDPSRHAPVGEHADTCPVAVSEADQARADAAELARRGPGSDYVRPLSYAEVAQFSMTGTPIPRNVRRKTRVHVTAAGPGTVLRTVVYGGRARAMMIASVPADAR